VYSTLAASSLLYGCEIWASKQRNIKMLKTAELKFMRRTTEYNLLEKRRHDILKEFKVDDPVEKKSAQYKQK
jgi:hypothetical protein